MNDNARTGKSEVEGMDDARVLREYGRDSPNDNGGRLVKCATRNQMAITDTCFRSPKRTKGYTAYTHAGPKVKHLRRLDCILVRQQDRRPVRNVTVHLELKSDIVWYPSLSVSSDERPPTANQGREEEIRKCVPTAKPSHQTDAGE